MFSELENPKKLILSPATIFIKQQSGSSLKEESLTLSFICIFSKVQNKH